MIFSHYSKWRMITAHLKRSGFVSGGVAGRHGGLAAG
jgi:hypothetical protein